MGQYLRRFIRFCFLDAEFGNKTMLFDLKKPEFDVMAFIFTPVLHFKTKLPRFNKQHGIQNVLYF